MPSLAALFAPSTSEAERSVPTIDSPVNSLRRLDHDGPATVGDVADDVGDAGLGARLALALEARGMSDGALQRAANLPKAYVGRLLRGERPNIGFQTLNAIAKALDVTYTWLATGEGPMNRGDAPSSPQAIVRELVARYPNAVEAASIAGRMGMESKAIEEVFGEVVRTDGLVGVEAPELVDVSLRAFGIPDRH